MRPKQVYTAYLLTDDEDKDEKIQLYKSYILVPSTEIKYPNAVTYKDPHLQIIRYFYYILVHTY